MERPDLERGPSPEGNAQHGSEANGAGRALTRHAGRRMIASGYEEAGHSGEEQTRPMAWGTFAHRGARSYRDQSLKNVNVSSLDHVSPI